jgi:hypothetical protein
VEHPDLPGPPEEIALNRRPFFRPAATLSVAILVAACGGTASTTAPTAATSSPAAATSAQTGATSSPAAATSAAATGTAVPATASAATSVAPSDLPSPCNGPCSAGRHRSLRLQPAVTFTVPEGWYGVEDGPGEYVLKYGSTVTNDGLFMFREPVAHSQRADCPMTADPTVGTSVKDLASWIASLPGLAATPPKAITVGGLAGFGLDVRLAASWTHACPYSDGEPNVPLIVSSFPRSDLDWGVGGKGRMRVYVLDAGAGRRLWIDVETIDGRNFDQLAARTTPVIESFGFSAP